jgi:flavin-dependent dehydrogenase
VSDRADVLILGGGPAGASVARLLALRGFSVELQHKASGARHSLAETLPPSIRNLFHLLGIQRRIDAAGFYRTTGNTSWWGSARKRVEQYPGPPGHQILRADFDQLLLTLAQEAGVRMTPGARKPAFTLDCTGRAGVLARKYRQPEPGFRTLALCGIWRGVLPGVDPRHTLVEAYPDGWVWSIPLEAGLRYVTVMTGRGSTYHAELAKTRAIRKLLAKCTLHGKPWGCDASLYTARRFAGDDFLLAGDAASFVDPISSFGVKKALTSAWVAAAAVTTCLRHPDRGTMALDYFEQCERQVYADHLRQAAAHYAQGAARFSTPFWTTRAERHTAPPNLRAALKKLHDARELRLHRGSGVTFEPRPAVVGNEIALRDTLVAPSLPAGLEYFHGVNLATLVKLADRQRQIPEFFAAYNRQEPVVPLASFLTALSFLLAVDALSSSPTRSGSPENFDGRSFFS